MQQAATLPPPRGHDAGVACHLSAWNMAENASWRSKYLEYPVGRASVETWRRRRRGMAVTEGGVAACSLSSATSRTARHHKAPKRTPAASVAQRRKNAARWAALASARAQLIGNSLRGATWEGRQPPVTGAPLRGRRRRYFKTRRGVRLRGGGTTVARTERKEPSARLPQRVASSTTAPAWRGDLRQRPPSVTSRDG